MLALLSLSNLAFLGLLVGLYFMIDSRVISFDLNSKKCNVDYNNCTTAIAIGGDDGGCLEIPSRPNAGCYSVCHATHTKSGICDRHQVCRGDCLGNCPTFDDTYDLCPDLPFHENVTASIEDDQLELVSLCWGQCSYQLRDLSTSPNSYFSYFTALGAYVNYTAGLAYTDQEDMRSACARALVVTPTNTGSCIKVDWGFDGLTRKSTCIYQWTCADVALQNTADPFKKRSIASSESMPGTAKEALMSKRAHVHLTPNQRALKESTQKAQQGHKKHGGTATVAATSTN